jgi:hypothetical protein
MANERKKASLCHLCLASVARAGTARSAPTPWCHPVVVELPSGNGLWNASTARIDTIRQQVDLSGRGAAVDHASDSPIQAMSPRPARGRDLMTALTMDS